MRILHERGDEDVARVFVAVTDDGHRFELVDPAPRGDTWRPSLSTLVGCPVRCLMCDAGGSYEGRLTAAELLAQVEYLLHRRYPDGVTVPHLDLQLSRMGDPAFNAGVLELLDALPARLDVPALVPHLSTVAPASRGEWFEQLLRVKRRWYGEGRFQLQLSIGSTSAAARRRLVPVRCWTFDEMAAYGRRFNEPGDRRIVLSLAAVRGEPLVPTVLRRHFDPELFSLKLTPLNATRAAAAAGLAGLLDPEDAPAARELAAGFEEVGFEVNVDLGDPRESEIGASCGMHLGDRTGVPKPRRTRGAA